MAFYWHDDEEPSGILESFPTYRNQQRKRRKHAASFLGHQAVVTVKNATRSQQHGLFESIKLASRKEKNSKKTQQKDSKNCVFGRQEVERNHSKKNEKEKKKKARPERGKKASSKVT
ncbi:hypothetical protein Tco_1330635 [Tanacetum coccineum]